MGLFNKKSRDIIELEEDVYSNYQAACTIISGMTSYINQYLKSPLPQNYLVDRFTILVQFGMLKIALSDRGLNKDECKFLEGFAKKSGLDLLEVYNNTNPSRFPLIWKDFMILDAKTYNIICDDILDEMNIIIKNLMRNFAIHQRVKYGQKRISMAHINDVEYLSEHAFSSEINTILHLLIVLEASFSGVDGDIAGSETNTLLDIQVNNFYAPLIEALLDIDAITVE